MKKLIVALMFLVGCATNDKAWTKPGSTEQDFYIDTGQCRAQAYSVPGTPPMQLALIFESCMQGKGWYLESRPKN